MKKKNFVTLLMSVVGGLLFALGMCMALLPEWDAMIPGIVLGAAGVLVLLAMLLIRRKMDGKPAVKLSGRAVGAALLGLRARELPLWEPTVRGELASGRPVICIMGPGHFTTTGHYIVITSCDADGYHVLDPARQTNCGPWSWEDISGEIRNLWSYELAE